MQRLDACDMEFDFAGLLQLAHLVDAVLRGAEAVAVMHQRQLLRDRREIDRPVERAVAAAGDQDVLAAEGAPSCARRNARLPSPIFIGSMPATGGRLGTKLPAPAAITTTGAMIRCRHRW
jgi:hypothetical protein